MKHVQVGHRWATQFFTAMGATALSMGLLACGGGGDLSNTAPDSSASANTPADLLQAQAVAATYSIGGKVGGMDEGKSIVLRNNGGNALTVTANGVFAFSQKLASGANYNVTIATLPSGQTCDLVRPSGTVHTSDVTDIRVFCSGGAGVPTPTYTVGGSTSGLGTGKTVVLQDGQGHTQSVTANGPFTFATALADGSTYNVAVATQPTGQNCTVANGNGTLSGANVSNVSVSCVTAAASIWSNFTVDVNGAGKARLTLVSSEALTVNAPFFGIEVRKNGVDITDDIVQVETVSPTSWRYTFGTQTLNTPGATLNVSLQNKVLGSPGHYVAARGYGSAGSVEGAYNLLVDCQAGVGECAGRGAKPGLVAAVKGISARYEPRDLETRTAGATLSTFNFSPIFNDAAFLATKGKKLNVIFTMKSFGKSTLYSGNGSNKTFDIPTGPDGWDGDRPREVKVYVKSGTDWNPVPFAFNAARTKVVLNTAPPSGTKNVNVVYARDPFPDYVWSMTPPVASWYHGVGGQSNGSSSVGGNYGHVYAPWRASTVTWMRNFMAGFQSEWNKAIADGTLPADAIESITIQETANPLGDTGSETHDPAYTPEGYRLGLFELSKSIARAVRRKALFGQMFNVIPGGNQTNQMPTLAEEIIAWGARLEGSDLFNKELGLENNVYENVHRAFNDKALTMIWQQNASYSERINKTINNYTLSNLYTPAQQFQKAKKDVNDSSTPGGTLGLRAEYVFWNMTTDAPLGSPLNFTKDAVPVIAANPVIQTSGNDRYLWKKAANGQAIADQNLTIVNP